MSGGETLFVTIGLKSVINASGNVQGLFLRNFMINFVSSNTIRSHR